MKELLGPKDGIIRLCKNENPYGPARSALNMMDYAAKKGAYYPEQARNSLAQKIAERHGVDPCQVVITTGSTEALSAVTLLYGKNRRVITPDLFYDTPVLYAEKLGLTKIQRVNLTSEMFLDLPAIEAQVSYDTGLVYLCNPNNPTGTIMPAAQIKSSVRRMAAQATVLVDEAYIEITDDPEGNSCVDLIKDGCNVIISRTFSKIYGMAGIRVGYTLSSAESAQKIRETVMSWVSGVGLAGAIGCYDDIEFLDYSKRKIITCREMVYETFKSLEFDVLPSQANFIYFKSGKPASCLQKQLVSQNIIISEQFMDYKDWSRVSMSRIQDIEKFCDVLPKLM